MKYTHTHIHTYIHTEQQAYMHTYTYTFTYIHDPYQNTSDNNYRTLKQSHPSREPEALR